MNKPRFFLILAWLLSLILAFIVGFHSSSLSEGELRKTSDLSSDEMSTATPLEQAQNSIKYQIPQPHGPSAQTYAKIDQRLITPELRFKEKVLNAPLDELFLMLEKLTSFVLPGKEAYKLRDVLLEIGKRSPKEGMKLIRKFGKNSTHYLIEKTMISWTQQSPDEAMRWLQNQNHTLEQSLLNQANSGLFQGLWSQNPAQAIRFLFEEGSQVTSFYGIVQTVLDSNQMELFLDMSLPHLDHANKRTELANIMRSWSQHDPQRAFNWLQHNNLSSLNQQEILTAIAGGIISQSPDQAIPWIRSLKIEDQSHLLQTLSISFKNEGRTDLIEEWLETADLTTFDDRQLIGVIADLDLENLASIEKWAARLNDSERVSEYFNTLGSRLRWEDPSGSSLERLLTQSSNPEHTDALILGFIPSGRSTVNGIERTYDFNQMLDYASMIQDSRTQNDAIYRLLSYSSNKPENLQELRDYINTQGALSPEDRSRLLDHVQSSLDSDG